MGFQPTDEQQAAIDACAAGQNTVIEAGAGAGKTATLKLVADALPGRRIFYGAFNKSIAIEAAAKFPQHVTCKTIHSLAFGRVGRLYRKRLNGARQPAREVASILGITSGALLGEVELRPTTIARLAVETVEKFCNSADDELAWRHVPRVTGIDDKGDVEALKRLVLPYAVKIWEDLQRTDAQGGGRFQFGHGHYRKIFALQNPRLPFDVILLDEAQDTPPVVGRLMLDQPHAQRIVVGDRAQAIYQWAGGSMSTIDEFDADARLQLTRSFRFGQEVADEGNKWLALLDDCTMRITGTGRSTIGPLSQPDAVLTRTNGGAADEVLRAQDAGIPVALVGGGSSIKMLAKACQELQAGRPSSHPELVAFRTWGEVQDYVTHDSTGADLRAFVKLIDRWSPEVVIQSMDRLVPEERARRTVSTAHKSKGLEWPRVRIGTDFQEPTDEHGNEADPQPEEVRLAYVAVTRAQEHLDPGGLRWIDDRRVRNSIKAETSADALL